MKEHEVFVFIAAIADGGMFQASPGEDCDIVIKLTVQLACRMALDASC